MAATRTRAYLSLSHTAWCRYGRHRLTHMFYGWQLDSIVGWDESRLTMPVDVRHTFEPVFVLTRPVQGARRTEL
jgi:hypothetical protein